MSERIIDLFKEFEHIATSPIPESSKVREVNIVLSKIIEEGRGVH